MKTNRLSYKTVLLAALAIAGLPAISNAQLLYQDELQVNEPPGDNGGVPPTAAGGTINGNAVLYSPGAGAANGATSGAHWAATAGVTYTANTGALLTGNNTATLSLVPISAETYTLTATLFPQTDTNVELGFGNGTSLNAYIIDTGSTAMLYAGTAHTSITGFVASPLGAAFTLTLSNLGGNETASVYTGPGSSVVSLAFNGTGIVPGGTFTDVGFSSAGSSSETAGVENFSLTATPEPSSWALALLCMGLFVFLRFRSRGRWFNRGI